MENERMIPNFTDMPNFVLDEVIPRLPETEVRVLLALMRKQWGYEPNKENYGMTIRRIVEYSRISKTSVESALKKLIEKQLVKNSTIYYEVETKNADGWIRFLSEAKNE